MKIVKWKKPFEERLETSPVIFDTPFSGIFRNIFGEELLEREFASFMPSVNISEENDFYTIELAAPGFDKSDLTIEIKGDLICISGQHKAENEVKGKMFTRKEFNYGSFYRSFPLPEGINNEKIEGKYENGILSIALPKMEMVRPVMKKIEIK